CARSPLHEDAATRTASGKRRQRHGRAIGWPAGCFNPALRKFMSSLEGMIIVVTGSGRGIGASAAEELARRGATVAVTARSHEHAKAVADRIGAAGGKVRR